MHRALATTFLALSFLTAGLNSEAKAAYSDTSFNLSDSSTAAAGAAAGAAKTGDMFGSTGNGVAADSSSNTGAAAPANQGKRIVRLRPSLHSGAGSAAVSAQKQAAQGTVGSRLATIVIGSVVGVPISMVKISKSESIIATKELVGDNAHWWLLAIGAPLGVPAGVISGVFQGFIYGPYHAWKYGDRPFCAEAFSLGDAK